MLNFISKTLRIQTISNDREPKCRRGYTHGITSDKRRLLLVPGPLAARIIKRTNEDCQTQELPSFASSTTEIVILVCGTHVYNYVLYIICVKSVVELMQCLSFFKELPEARRKGVLMTLN